MKQLVILISPITPHISEKIYQNLVRGVEKDAPESVHMEDWKFDENLIREIWREYGLLFGRLLRPVLG